MPASCSRMLFLLAFAVTVVAALPNRAPAADAQAKPLVRIAFGSCAHQDQPQPIWDSIVAWRPQLFLFIGDNIYGDTEDPAELKAKYAKLGQQPGYQRLKAHCPILATWDDHDYGVNDGGAEYAQREASQQIFNDFFEVPSDSPRRRRPGIYDAQIFGPAGRRVQIILLDTRYFRSALKKNPAGRPAGLGPYLADSSPDTTMLGAAQWKWLAAQLEKPAELRIVASSIQVVPREHGWEMWGTMPKERERMFKAIGKAKANGVIFISGDRHLAEISRVPTGTESAPYPLYDITSSSLNRPSGGGNEGEPNRFRISGQYFKTNFGTLNIDWKGADATVTLTVHDAKGRPAEMKKVRLAELK